MFSNSAWRLNFGGGAPVRVERRGRRTEEFGELVSDPVYVGAAIQATLAGGTSLTMRGLAIDKGHRPTDAELAAVRDAVVIRPSRR